MTPSSEHNKKFIEKHDQVTQTEHFFVIIRDAAIEKGLFGPINVLGNESKREQERTKKGVRKDFLTS